MEFSVNAVFGTNSPVFLFKILQIGVGLGGLGNLYSMHLHSLLWLKAKQDSLHDWKRNMKYFIKTKYMIFHYAIGLLQYPPMIAYRPATRLCTFWWVSWDSGLVLVENWRHKSTNETETEQNSIPIILSLIELNSSFTDCFF